MARIRYVTQATLDRVTVAATYSGGGFKGPVEAGHAESHAETLAPAPELAGHRGKLTHAQLVKAIQAGTWHPTRAVFGTSVGSLVGYMVAAGKVPELVAMFEALHDANPWNGIKGYSRLSPGLQHGIWTLRPLVEVLERLVDARDLRVPFGCGVVERETGRHHVLLFGPDSDTRLLRRALHASAAIAGVFVPPPPFPLEDRMVTLLDGGHRHHWPLPDAEAVPALKTLHAVSCSPLELRPQESSNGLIDALAWAASIAMHNTIEGDLHQLEALVARGVTVRRYAPTERVGSLLRADREITRRRLAIGRGKMLREPVIMAPKKPTPTKQRKPRGK